jgi:hypothetical protein
MYYCLFETLSTISMVWIHLRSFVLFSRKGFFLLLLLLLPRMFKIVGSSYIVYVCVSSMFVLTMYMNNIFHLLFSVRWTTFLSFYFLRAQPIDIRSTLFVWTNQFRPLFLSRKKGWIDECMSPFVRLSNEVDQTRGDIDFPRVINILMLSWSIHFSFFLCLLIL